MFMEFGGPRKGNRAINEYKKHMERCRNPQKKIDNAPIQLDLGRMFKVATLQSDGAALGRFESENRKLLTNMSIIYRSKGKVDCDVMTYPFSSNYEERFFTNRAIEKKNIALYNLIKNKQSNYKASDMELEYARERKKFLKTAGKDPNQKPLRVEQDWSIIPEGITQKPDPSKRVKCFFDIQAKHERKGELINIGRIHIEVYRDFAPIAGENFIRLCRGDNGLSYKGTIIHKVFPGKVCIAGDVEMRKGLGGKSAYGFPIPNEDPILDFNGPGVFGTYTPDPGKNTSQFLITFGEMRPLKKKFVAFGKVIYGRAMEVVEEFGSKSGFPQMVMTITKCGVLSPEAERKARHGPTEIPSELIELTEKLKNEEDRDRRKRLDFEEKQQFYKKYGYLTKLDPKIDYPPFPWKLPKIEEPSESEENVKNGDSKENATDEQNKIQQNGTSNYIKVE